MPSASQPVAQAAAELARLVLARPARAGGPRVVALDGPSGSGKTTLSGARAAGGRAHGTSTAVFHLDDLYPGWDGLAEAVPLLVARVLVPLAAGAPAGSARWDWTASRWSEERVEVPAADVLVVEGSGAGSRACAPHLSVLAWVEAREDVRRERALARDGEGYRPHWDRWAAQEAALFSAEGTRERADLRLVT